MTRETIEAALEQNLKRIHCRMPERGEAKNDVCTVQISSEDSSRTHLRAWATVGIADAQTYPELLIGWKIGLITRTDGVVDYQLAFTNERGEAWFGNPVPKAAECWLELVTATLEELIRAEVAAREQESRLDTHETPPNVVVVPEAFSMPSRALAGLALAASSGKDGPGSLKSSAGPSPSIHLEVPGCGRITGTLSPAYQGVRKLTLTAPKGPLRVAVYVRQKDGSRSLLGEVLLESMGKTGPLAYSGQLLGIPAANIGDGDLELEQLK